ncbi:AlpA family transcriptional regulator [Burkholderia cepacia]|uniref:helix-turn-helix transcriptional regulator n=1 Tax=Burkholderia cepacia TaxID=292 RepID=UPI00249EEBCA|nr:AlpA family transcriptional regulator [Burkholderia cepacia]WGY67329.1 AlpA family transcriptional regulator [Burkholderia cepacia]
MEQKPKRVLRIEDVTYKVGMPRSSVYAAIARGEFPAAIKLGVKASGWLESEVDAWIDARVAASRGQKETGVAR